MIVTKRYEWCMGHRLPYHQGACVRLHGHNYAAEIDVTGPIQEGSAPDAGMVMDFKAVKHAITEQIGAWDHRTMLHETDQLLSDYTPESQKLWGVFRVTFIPTAENIATEIMRRLRAVGVNVTRVRVYEQPDGWAEVLA